MTSPTQGREICAHFVPIGLPCDDCAAGLSAFDVERLIEHCIPGGSICDPQLVADNIRAWFTALKPSKWHAENDNYGFAARLVRDDGLIVHLNPGTECNRLGVPALLSDLHQ